MDRQFDEKPQPQVVGLKFRPWRPVALHGGPNLRDASSAAFGHFQFFEELSDATIPARELLEICVVVNEYCVDSLSQRFVIREYARKPFKRITP